MTTHVVFTDSPTEDTITAGIDFAAELDAYALKASPAFTGTPTAPTATLGTNTTQLATCAFVAAATAAIDLTPYAPKASPTFTGTPAAPTATPGTNTTQLATCAFVQAAITALGASGGSQIAYKNAANTFSQDQTFSGNILPSATSTIGVTGTRPSKVWVGSGGIESTGVVLVPNGTQAIPSISFASDTDTGFYRLQENYIAATLGNAVPFGFSSSSSHGAIQLANAYAIAWATAVTSASDLFLYRGGAGILAQRNGANSQTYEIFRTYTDSSNNALARFNFSGNDFRISTVGNGTGTVGNLVLLAGSASYTFGTGFGAIFPGSLQIGGAVILPGSSGVQFNGQGYIKASATGLINLLNQASNSFTRLTFGLENNSSPALAVNGTGLDLTLGDGTGNGQLKADKFLTTNPSGGTAAAWKLGSKAAATVALDTANYVQVEIGGVAYKLALVT